MDAEKVLEFCYKMREIWERQNIRGNDKNALLKLRKEIVMPKSTLKYSYPEYADICNMILELEDDIKYKEAKTLGRNNEKKRTSSAKKILGAGINGKRALEGYKDIGDGKVVICNGYILYEGDSIVGIQETPDPDSYPDFDKMWNIDVVGEFDLTSDDIADIKARLTQGRIETGKRRAVNIVNAGNDNGVVVWKHVGETANAFNADYIVWATEMLGGKEWHVKLGKHAKPCTIEGERGRVLVLPIYRREDPARIDKEVA